jgi:two-component sensor histidine kinase
MALPEGSSDLVWDVVRLRIATDAAGVGLWSWNVDTDEIALDERSHRMWGVPGSGPLTFETLSAQIHPADLNRVRTAFEQTRSTKGGYEIDFRILRDGLIRWVSARGQGDGIGRVGRVTFGIFMDVTDRKLSEEATELLAAEMVHRVKNLFAITSALTAIAARSTTTTAQMAHDLTQRLSALSKAHDLVRHVPGHEKKGGALLADLLAALLAPYGEPTSGSRVRIAVPEVSIGRNAVTTLALVIHELATNSIKYGALSRPSGTLDVTGSSNNGEIVLVWCERGGPAVTVPTGPNGFGTNLISRSLSGQLGGSIALDWPAEGLVATLRASETRLAT